MTPHDPQPDPRRQAQPRAQAAPPWTAASVSRPVLTRRAVGPSQAAARPAATKRCRSAA
jgi:hypothetical protein